jgi:iron(III) transport system substrate-binding protein
MMATSLAFVVALAQPQKPRSLSEILVIGDDEKGVRSDIVRLLPDNREEWFQETNPEGVARVDPTYECKRGERFKAKPRDRIYYDSRPTSCQTPRLKIEVIIRLQALYDRAVQSKELLIIYSTTTSARIFASFEKRFPGIKVILTSGASSKLAARAISEARAGTAVADVFHGSLEHVLLMGRQELLSEKLPVEAADYPSDLKGPFWVASSLVLYGSAWNTHLVNKKDEPKSFEDLSAPKWKGKLIADPANLDVLIALVTQKYSSDEKATSLFKGIAANKVEFHRGQSTLIERLASGEGVICLACNLSISQSLIKKGAPVDYMRTEAAATIRATGVLRSASHPSAAWLFARWLASEEGQKAVTESGTTAAYPKAEPTGSSRPKNIYTVGAAELDKQLTYQRLLNKIFEIR